MEEIRKRRSVLLINNALLLVFGIVITTGVVPSWLNSSFGVSIKHALIGEAVCLGTSFIQYLIAFIRFAKAVKKETGTYHFILAFLSQMPTEED